MTELLQQAKNWLDQDPDPVTRAELENLIQANDLDGLADRFSKRLEFGTAGLRGELGAGPNRMNRVLVAQAAAGLGKYLGPGSSVVIGFDGRINSEIFAKDSAEVLAAAGEVIFRTLDAGSDKPLPYLGLAEEENPSLGVRGFRINDVDQSVIATQLQALAAAEKQTNRPVSVMAPMIATVEEAKAFAELASGFGLKTIGVMVETPSICVQIKELAGVVDFVSIGTNDLSQYLFAADRQNSAVAALLNPWQPALLRTFGQICIDANSAGIKVGVCGEAGADPLLAVVLAGLGVQSVSMAAPAVPKAIEYLSSVSLDQARKIAAQALLGTNPRQAKELARTALG